MKIINNVYMYFFLILSIVFQSFSFVFSKLAAVSLENTPFIFYIVNKYYFLSLVCLGIQAIFWQKTLNKMELSKAYPYTALIYLFILIYTYFIFKEPISINNIIGTIIIMIGIFVMNFEKESSIY
ncbi:EamA family transporter [Lysinibacillus sp. UGB7]|uniref:EamA family transporter n=1 Tax=Lysinibacillus sp. UGB7 TaxID=3411039 RepID=UPI003B7F83A9